MKCLLLWIALLGCGPNLLAQNPHFFVPGRYFVMAPSGLNLRDDAGLQGAKLVTIPYGTAVEVLACDYRSLEAGWRRGYWAQVRYDEQVGYLYGAYLCQLPVPVAYEWPAGSCEYGQETGYQLRLATYLRRFWPEPQDSQTLLSLGEREKTRHLQRRSLDQMTAVVSEQYYEGTITHLRFHGDLYQAHALLVALLQACPEALSLAENPEWIRDAKGNLVRIQDSQLGGWLFTIQQIDSYTVQLSMGSGS
jgi:hypothetical protein